MNKNNSHIDIWFSRIVFLLLFFIVFSISGNSVEDNNANGNNISIESIENIPNIAILGTKAEVPEYNSKIQVSELLIVKLNDKRTDLLQENSDISLQYNLNKIRYNSIKPNLVQLLFIFYNENTSETVPLIS